ncbi:MAG: divergent polysaccharide deacetylase family protein [Candidatus Omnitrophota bacterium]
MNKKIYIAIIIILAATAFINWHRARELSESLRMIRVRIEDTAKALEEQRTLREDAEGKLEAKLKIEAEARSAAKKYVKRYAVTKEGAKIAIVLDDWGYNLRNLNTLLEIEAPITLSVLPNLPYSRVVARNAYVDGKEIILHLPLEPREPMSLEKDTITTEMTDKEALENLERAILSIPHLKGVSNHMGSKATEDKRLMRTLFKKIKNDGFYFLDSRVTTRSVCFEMADDVGVKFAARSVFLDNELNTEYIKGQIRETARQALLTGWAIGIGHDRAVTVAALAEMIPQLKEMGIEIVPVSEIAR